MVCSVLTAVPPLASQPTARTERKVAMPSTRRRFLQQVSLAAVAVTPLAARGAAAAAGAQAQDDGVPFVIAQPCIGAKDAACLAVCPVDAIREGEDQYYINPTECISCGLCEPECPVTAIFRADSLPDGFQSYAEKNKRFFGL
jgi:ferredoxin